MSLSLFSGRAPSRTWLLSLLFISLGAIFGFAQDENNNMANLDNDAKDLESYSEDRSLPAGQIVVDGLNSAKHFDAIHVGVAGGGMIFGWADLDGDNTEVELVVSDPTLESGKIRTADADGDGDPEVIWVGTKGADMDGDGKVTPEESGAVVGIVDVIGDGEPEIIILDNSLTLGSYTAAGFDLKPKKKNPGIEVVWIGTLNENGRSRAAALDDIADLESDGDDEIILRDISTSDSSGQSFGIQAFDIDHDKDDDIVIRH
ncbi:hypothetical protein HY229_03380 [Candidatus Acetothermia bacterium]|nr:hypothetical protein [Candidatus Acetothermia bacterium]MBI3643125.1 hypothetical protein [Candidatus Acetothermia bacterium]